jgi:hypothetical protein
VRREVADINRKKNARVGSLERYNLNQPRGGPQAAYLIDAEPCAARLGLPSSVVRYHDAIGADCRPILAFNRRGWPIWRPRKSFNICHGTLGSLAMLAAIGRASSSVSVNNLRPSALFREGLG